MPHQKQIWPIIILNVLLWLGFVCLVYYSDPELFINVKCLILNVKLPVSQIAFFVLLTSALTLTLGLILRSTKKGFALALGISLFLLLKMLHSLNWLNILILIILTIIMLLA